jgi:hypothetical protein
MLVVVCKRQTVERRTREDQQVGERRGHARGAAAVGEPNGARPGVGRDGVLGQERFVPAERLSFGVVGDAALELEPDRRAPRPKLVDTQ